MDSLSQKKKKNMLRKRKTCHAMKIYIHVSKIELKISFYLSLISHTF